MKKKTITMTENQKKMLIRAALTTSAVGGSYILLRKLLKSDAACQIEEKLLERLAKYHIDTHQLGFYALYGSYKNVIPKDVHPQIDAAIAQIVDPILEGLGG